MTDFLSMPLPALIIVKATIVLLAGAGITFALRRSSASARYSVWALTLAAVLALPIGSVILPSVNVAIRSQAAPPTEATLLADVPPARRETDPSATAARTLDPVVSSTAATGRSENILGRLRQSADSRLLIVGVWLAGFLSIVTRMIAGRIALGRIARRAVRPVGENWQNDIDREARVAGIPDGIRVLLSSEVGTPLAAGIVSPLILLPADADEWTADHRQVVLRHELAHIASSDAVVCAMSGVACAVYWFHPLVWMTARKLRTEQERACDDRVLSLGTPAPDYAAHILEVARTARSMGMDGFVSMAMARPTQLEGRLLAVLSTTRSRRTLRRRQIMTAAFTTLALLGVLAALKPVAVSAAIVVASQSFPTMSLEPVAVRAVTTPDPDRWVVDSLIEREIAVSPGGTLELDLKTGAGIIVRSWDRPRLRMRATLAGRSWRDTEIDLVPSGSGARITTRFHTARRNQSTSHRIELMVPRRFNIRVESSGGEIDIENVEGEFSGSTGGGEITIDRGRGRANLSTGGGAVTVTNSTMSGRVSTGGGGVLLQGVKGGLRGSSGSGTVIYGEDGLTYSKADDDGVVRASNGRVIVNKSGGSVTIDTAPKGATISTGGGSIRVGSAGGSVSVKTGGGNVEIGPLDGSAEAHTGAGDVIITLDNEDTKGVDITSGSGTVTLMVPRNLAAQLDLETAYTNNRSRATRIVSDIPLSTTETDEWDSRYGTPRRYVRANQAVGGGGRRVRVRTVNGNIVIRVR
jgi:beta-lactamase regulating signal transducer with metallopeptidase domain/DUF4097 and DUF4098 domain-containing protein YvlB